MNITEDECAKCGSTLEEVRPGKWQCTKCELENLLARHLNAGKQAVPLSAEEYMVAYNTGYQAGLAKSQRDDDDAFWLRQYAGQAMQGILANNKLLSAFIAVGYEIGPTQLKNISKGAVAQAKTLLEEVNK